MAQNISAHVLAIAFEMDIQLPIGLYTDPLGVSGIVAADRKKSSDNARNLLDFFETTARASGTAHSQSLLRCAPIEISKRLVHEARFRDITMIPLKEGDAAQQDIAERLVFESGRPILVFPDDSRREVPTSLGNVAVAWNNSRPSTRAAERAMNAKIALMLPNPRDAHHEADHDAQRGGDRDSQRADTGRRPFASTLDGSASSSRRPVRAPARTSEGRNDRV